MAMQTKSESDNTSGMARRAFMYWGNSWSNRMAVSWVSRKPPFLVQIDPRPGTPSLAQIVFPKWGVVGHMLRERNSPDNTVLSMNEVY